MSARATGPGRRVAPVVRGPRLVGLAAVLTVLAAGATAALVPDAPRTVVPDTAPTSTAVTSSLLVCPAAPAPPRGRAEVTAGRASGAGPLRAGDLTVDLPAVGSRAVTATPGTPLLLTAEGAAAPGVFAARTDLAPGGADVVACPGPRASWWFTGAGATLGRRSDLVLTNPDDAPAVLDVRVYGAAGLLDTPGLRGLTLRAGETRRVALVDVVSLTDGAELTVAVHATRGRVAAGLLDTRRAAGAEGRAWVAASAEPATTVRVVGVPTAGRRTLLVTNPGPDQALVRLRVQTTSGVFVPLGQGDLSVDPGSVTSVDVGPVLGADTAALELTSTTPVTAAVRTTGGRAGLATTPVGTALAGDAVAVLPGVTGARAAVQLAADADGGRVRLRALAADGSATGTADVTLRPGTAAAWPVPAGTAFVVASPRAGAVVAGLVLTAPDVAVEPFLAVPGTLLRPVVLPAQPAS